MTQVVFDPIAFKVLFPEFALVPDARLDFFFLRATLILSNEDDSIVQDIPTRELILDLITAHIAALAGALSADGKPQPVGRLSEAHEGTVGASFQYDVGRSAAWFIQTQYGAEAFQMLKLAMSAAYIPGTTNVY